MATSHARMIPTESTHAHEGLVGRVLDRRYELEALLGAGGMGAVYRATHTGLRRAVAVKVLHPEFGANLSCTKRFEREARSLSRLDHPNCVHVTDSGASVDGIKYLVMELLEGEELTARLGRNHVWEPEAACDLLVQLLAGLEHAHHHGIVHRDLKPANVFMTSDSCGREVAKIVDFGIAKLLDANGTVDVVTQEGTVLGTPHYMSPEQAAGGQADERSDLYAIGVLAYELLTGAPPFDAEDVGGVLRMQIIAPPPPLPDAVPAPLAAWVATMLEKSPHHRPTSAAEARAQLIEIQTRDLLQADTVVAHRYCVVGYRRDRGFGQIYEAQDTAMETRVSLMRLAPEFSRPRVRESLFEIRNTAQVEDPRVVDLTDYGEDFDGRLFLVMPWVEDAVALDEFVEREGALPWPRVKSIIGQIAGALGAAHAKGILHGGLEPSRVLIDADDCVHVVDFGLAPALTRPGGQPVTNTSRLPGNVAYLSPAQVRGEAVDSSCDIYALGVMLWELVSGAPPFVGDPLNVASAQLERPLPELTRRGAPADLEALLQITLAKAKDDRLATIEEFSTLLRAMPAAVETTSRSARAKSTPTLSLMSTGRIRGSKRAGGGYPAPTTHTPTRAQNKDSGPGRETTPLATTIPLRALQPANVPPPVPQLTPVSQENATPTPAHTPEHPPTLPQAINTPTTQDCSTAASPGPVSPPVANSRIGELELAIIVFLAFNVLVFSAWRVFADDPHDVPEIATATETPAPKAASAAQPTVPAQAPADDGSSAPSSPLSVHGAIASKLPPEPDSHSPVRPMDRSLTNRDFREAMLDARDDILDHCLETRMRRTLKVSLKVAPSGHVSFARVIGALADTRLGACVVKQVYRANLPVTQKGGSHTYTLRLR